MYTYLIHYIFTQLWAYLQDYVFYIDRMDSINYIAVFVELLLTIFASVLYDKHRKNKVAKAKIRRV